MNLETIGQRIRELRESLEVKTTQKTFAESMGMSRSQLNAYERNDVIPSDAVLKLICMTYDINWAWLKDGEGDMKNPPDTADEMVDRIMTGDESFKKSVFRAFARLGDDEWLALKKLYDTIKKECE